MKLQKSIHDIVHDSGMSSRPEFYSGRGATLSDLNSRILDYERQSSYDDGIFGYRRRY